MGKTSTGEERESKRAKRKELIKQRNIAKKKKKQAVLEQRREQRKAVKELEKAKKKAQKDSRSKPLDSVDQLLTISERVNQQLEGKIEVAAQKEVCTLLFFY